MNEFVIDKNRYRVRYQHVIKDRAINNPALVSEFAKDMKKRKAVTVATVERMVWIDPRSDLDCTLNHEQWVLVARGVAFCGKKDNFSKEAGRSVALVKLVQGMLDRQAMYLAGRIMMALGTDDSVAMAIGTIRLGVVLNKQSGRMLVHASPEGRARLNVGKLDFD